MGNINIKCPKNTGSLHFCYKQRFSIVLLALIDYNRKFLYIDVGAYGKQSDGGVFRNSSLYREIINHTLGLPPPMPFPGTNEEMPYVMVADNAFPLSNYLMKPFPKKNLTLEEIKYNARLSHARVSVERSFGGIVKKFDTLNKPMEIGVDYAEIIVKCICILHNIIISLEGLPDDVDQIDITNLNVRPMSVIRDNNASSNEARNIRNSFKIF
ncbi:uncharacterized protein LOC135925420 [Gordionus sp. m RMFG-2023]|uniref:uncharacterized protein LOC135925420 n=1 Tax=Gordionus sp. m RMFG-2023 TaxID=3053472 RepID=UPI0031FBF829